MKTEEELCRWYQQFKQTYIASCFSLEACICYTDGKTSWWEAGGKVFSGQLSKGIEVFFVAVHSGTGSKALLSVRDLTDVAMVFISTCLLIHAAWCFGREGERLSLTTLGTLHRVRAVGRKTGTRPDVPLCKAERRDLAGFPCFPWNCCRLPACEEPGRTTLTFHQDFCKIIFMRCFVLFSWPGHSPKASL